MDMPLPNPLILSRKARIVDRLLAILPRDAVIDGGCVTKKVCPWCRAALAPRWPGGHCRRQIA